MKVSKKYFERVMKALHRNRLPDDMSVEGFENGYHEVQRKIIAGMLNPEITTVFAACARKVGKQLCLDTKIFTPDRGFIKYGDLRVNDKIYNEKGEVQHVVELHDINISPESYRVWFCNGEYIDACSDHLWDTWTALQRKRFRRNGALPEITTKSTKEILETLKHGKEYNHSIPYTKPIQLPEQNLDVDPYLLGFWLGDGHKSSGKITTTDYEVLDQIKGLGYEITSYDYKEHNVLNLVPSLRALGVLDFKKVPHKYLMGSISQRYALLQGLMDSDGTIDKKKGLCTFDNTNPNLSDAVFYLAASLGMKPCRNIKQGRLNGADKKICYRVFFHPMGNPVFRLERKQKYVKALKKTPHHTIVKIERIESKPMRCITVSGDSSLYTVTDSFIATHNTETALYVLHRQALLVPNSACYYICPTRKDGKDIIWDVRRLQDFLGPDADYFVERIDNRDLTVFYKNGSFIQIRGAERYENANGISPDILVYDEFKAFHKEFHRTMSMNKAAKGAKLLIIGTKADYMANNKTEYWSKYNSAKKSKNQLLIEAETFDNPMNHRPHIKHIIMEDIEDLRNQGREEVVQREYYNKIIPGGSNAIFPEFSPKAHVAKHAEVMSQVNAQFNEGQFYQIIDPATSSVFGGLFVFHNPYTGKVFVMDELYEEDLRNVGITKVFPKIRQIAAELTGSDDFQGLWYPVYDEAALWAANEIMDNYKVAYVSTSKATMSQEGGISIIKYLLAKNMIVISDRCANLIEEILGYKRDGNGQIKKGLCADHNIDSLRYFIQAANYTVNLENREVKEVPRPELYYTRGLAEELDKDSIFNIDIDIDLDFDLDDF